MTPLQKAPDANPDSSDSSLPRAQRLIAGKVPGWLASASPDVLNQLRLSSKTPVPWFAAACRSHPQEARLLVQEYGALQQHLAQVQALLEPLPDLEQFATQQLSQAIKDRFELDLDVSKTYLINARKAADYKLSMNGDPAVDAQRALKLATQSLLHCALQNFEAAEAQPSGLDADALPSAIVDSNEFVYLQPTGNKVDIVPETFAALSRKLDIGGQYQALIDAVFSPATETSDNTADEVLQTFKNAEQSAFRLHVHRAYLSQAIDQPLYEALLKLASGEQAQYQGSPMRCGFMKIFDVTLVGALVIGVVPSPELLLAYDPLLLPHKGMLVTYVPGLPVPLKKHSSIHEAQAYLREQLWAAHVPHLLELVPARHRYALTNTLRDCLQPAIWNTATQQYDRNRDTTAWIPVTLQPFTQPFLDELASQKQQRLKDDALFHAVSTALEDQKTAQKRNAYFSQLAFTSLAIGGFFIPGLGQLMLGLSVIQLSYEVYEGADSWAKGERQQALDYLVDVVENVALTAALGAAGAEAGKPAVERIPVEVPSFIEELEPVQLPSGQDRLWKPDLQPFAHDIVLPADLEPDEFGLYHHEGKTWLALEDQTYAVKQSEATGEYRLEPFDSALSYEPPLRHNGAGAWLHGLDRPREWQGIRLFRRLGHVSAQFSDETAVNILRVSGIDEAALRRMLSESERLPAQLEDTMQRFKLDQDVMQAYADAEPSLRNSEFDNRYRNLPANQAPEAAVIQRVYPQLPAAVTEELLRSATAQELQSLVEGKVPKRLGEEIRLYQQHVRITRAYEGLYLQSVPNADTDRLVLHSLNQLPEWAAETAIEFREGKFSPGLIDSIGPVDAPGRKIITRYPTGYVMSPPFASSFPQTMHETLYGALFEALSDTQRSALASSGVTDALTLKAHIQQAPLLPRWRLRNILGMQRPAFRSPMRLADGRLGYPLSGGGNLSDELSRSRLLTQISDIGLPQRLTASAEDILTSLQQTELSLAQIQARLEQLNAEHQELQESLAQWRATPGAITDQASREASRQDIEQAIWQQWSHSALPELSEQSQPLHLHQVFMAEFPTHLPDFISSRTRQLRLNDVYLDHSADHSLTWPQQETFLSTMFQHFPDLQRLDIERPYDASAQPSELSASLALIVRSFPQLTTLRFVNQNHVLTALDIEQLATREHLAHLDLSGNSFERSSTLRLPDWQLDYLGLDRMRFTRWPTWLNSDSLERLGEVSLQENSFTSVPEFLVSNEISPYHHSRVALNNNAILPAQLQNMHLSQDGQQRRFSFTLDLPAAIEARLSALMEERQQLREATFEYVNASSSSLPISNETLLARTRISEAIQNFWETVARGASLSPLHLEDLALSDFPSRLPPFFYDYVGHLRLSRIDTSPELLDQFLRRFPTLRSLMLEGHVQPLRALPPALAESATLTELSLLEQGLEIDQPVINDLARMPALTVLDLSGNRFSPALRGPIEFGHTLHRLYLRNMGLQSWPAWLDDLMPEHVLDLNDNLLIELPEHILSNPENDDGFTSISLIGNPLSDESMRRAHLSQGRHRGYTFEMDLPFEILSLQPLDYHSSTGSGSSPGSSPGSSTGSTGSATLAHRHSPVPWAPGDVPNVELWLQGSEQMRAVHSEQWHALEESAEAADLLNLVGRLTQSAPYRTVTSRSEFIDRVWRVLDMAAGMSDQRQLFNGMAQDGASNRTCHDGALLVFKQIEEQHLIRSEGTAPRTDNHEQSMYQLTRRLFRQRELDNIAREQAGSRDEAELRLAYHRRLATALDLPAPADHMLYESSVRLRRGERENVEARVREAQDGEAFLQFAAEFELWTNCLREVHAERFEAITNAYHEGERLLFEQFPDEPIDALEPQILALRENMVNEEQALIRELTNQAGGHQP
ncbi:NEL-type E3 ubiquitin ligase domain-containing protein [Pseudomonas sp. H9]|uniref:NEL-type E3 ubiquitin ligase domain-containing protein n=1 Tax=Pseudomonas sp. H9 TaxID=483968 RepID=UPI001057AF7F|nr:DUF6543 domain-containing protein [Pseudomonas sp. H9]TDF85036.1 hypothetical protein E1573_05180 [Pseudomonas sp. H9]